MTPQPVRHVPVLLEETLALLAPQPGGQLVDGTLGAGGHAEALLRAVGPRGRVFGIDRDPEALAIARDRLRSFGSSFVPVEGRHEDLTRLLADRDVDAVDGVLLDLGVSSMQLDQGDRGFSFREDGPLDMRMDPRAGESAADLVARLSATELRDLLRDLGEERRASAIARAIVREREASPIVRTRQLAELVERVLGPAARRYRLHPATRTFQALRIAVNDEVSGLSRAVEDAVGVLAPGGRLAVIAYHSLEDRAVKTTLARLADPCVCPPDLPVCGCGRRPVVRSLTRHPVRPSEQEIAANPRARSARLRAAEKLTEGGPR